MKLTIVARGLLSKTLVLAIAGLILMGQPGVTLAEPAAPSPPATNQPPAAASLEELQQRLSATLSQPRYTAALWGIKIMSLDSGKVWFSANAEKLFSPASNSKLYTMALALDTFGPEYRFRTSLFAESRPNAAGVLKGDLIIYGRGDPSISAEFLNANGKNGGANVLKALSPLVDALTNAGVRRIEGDIVGDESFLHIAPYGSGWSWDDMENYYGAEISALTLDANFTTLVIKPGAAKGQPAVLSFDPPTDYLRVINHTETVLKGAEHHLNIEHPLGQNTLIVSGQIPLEDHEQREDVTFHNPAAYFAAQFRQALLARGITVKGGARSVGWEERAQNPAAVTKWVELGSARFQAFRDIIRSVQKPSQNLYTDLLLDDIGAGLPTNESPMIKPENSESQGLVALRAFLKKAGIKPGETLFQDGSGLSRDNLTTPNATLALLTYMSHHKDFKTYFDALPIAGVDGTLKRRFKNTLLEGNLHGKTGTLHWANSLSGYLTNAAGEHLAICFMLNRYQPPNAEVSKTQDMDEMVLEAARTRFRSTP